MHIGSSFLPSAVRKKNPQKSSACMVCLNSLLTRQDMTRRTWSSLNINMTIDKSIGLVDLLLCPLCCGMNGGWSKYRVALDCWLVLCLSLMTDPTRPDPLESSRVQLQPFIICINFVGGFSLNGTRKCFRFISLPRFSSCVGRWGTVLVPVVLEAA